MPTLLSVAWSEVQPSSLSILEMTKRVGADNSYNYHLIIVFPIKIKIQRLSLAQIPYLVPNNFKFFFLMRTLQIVFLHPQKI